MSQPRMGQHRRIGHAAADEGHAADKTQTDNDRPTHREAREDEDPMRAMAARVTQIGK